MRILTFLAATGLLLAGCADDVASSDSAPTTSSTMSTATSTTPTSTTSTSTTSTTTSTPASITTSSLPTTTEDFETPAEFTTNEMIAARADTHTYIGGWTISPEFDAAVEQWGVGAGDAEQWYIDGGEMEVWVLDLLRRTDDGVPVWQRTDLIMIEVGQDQIFSARCRTDGEPVDGLTGIVADAGDEPWIAAHQAWQIDLDSLMVVQIDHGPVDCENVGFGI